MRRRAPLWGLIAVVACVGIGAWAQAKKSAGEEAESNIKRASFRYYLGNVFGDADEYMKAARLPIFVLRDGVGAYRSEKDTRALLVKLGEPTSKLSADDKKQLGINIMSAIDNASIQFLGSNTATLTFVIKPSTKPEEGDMLGMLVLYRKGDKWQVIQEITDSTAIPPEYLK